AGHHHVRERRQGGVGRLRRPVRGAPAEDQGEGGGGGEKAEDGAGGGGRGTAPEFSHVAQRRQQPGATARGIREVQVAVRHHRDDGGGRRPGRQEDDRVALRRLGKNEEWAAEQSYADCVRGSPRQNPQRQKTKMARRNEGSGRRPTQFVVFVAQI